MSQLILTPTSKKRTYDGDVVSTQPSPKMTVKSEDSCLEIPTQRASSPATSTTSSSLTELTSVSIPQTAGQELSVQQPKKRKLTFAEREVERALKKQEKEERERQKQEEKARREEEKRLRDEEKKAKNEEKEAVRKAKEHEREVARQAKELEREEKQKIKDAEKQEKEADKAQKEAERLKRERSQMKIASFFGRPALTTGPVSTSPSTADDESVSATSRRSSITSIDNKEQLHQPKAETSAESAYYKWILPFFPHEHTEMAPINRFRLHHEPQIFGGRGSAAKIEDLMVEDVDQHISSRFGKSRRKTRKILRVKDIVKRLNEMAEAPVDLTEERLLDQDSVELETIPYKCLSFKQDVRPPYQGTFTKTLSPRTSKKLARLPTWRGMPDTNYDYDSEAEWQEPEEGDDDLGEEDEMSEDEDDEEEMEDFLDDEADLGRRRIIVGDMEPVSSGLHWEGTTNETSGGFDLSLYRMSVLHDSTKFPIDPYSTNHWSEVDKVTPQKTKALLFAPNSSAAMQPPRLPLSTVNAPNHSSIHPFTISTNQEPRPIQDENGSLLPKQKGRNQNTNKPIKTIPDDILPAFKDAINGSDLNKVALTEILKKKFPKCSKDAIKDTLSAIAVRQGVKEADKRWVIIN